MPVAVADTLEFLIGRWTLQRTITDHRNGVGGTFTGTATVERDPAGAVYRESGRIDFGAHSGPAGRTLSFVELGEGAVRVDFQDGRPFLDLDLAGGLCEATHPCRADTYEMSFEALDAGQLREGWRVSGPEKDYGGLILKLGGVLVRRNVN